MDTQTSNLVFSVFCLSMCVCHKMHLTMRVKSLKDQDPSTQQPPKTQKEFIPSVTAELANASFLKMSTIVDLPLLKLFLSDGLLLALQPDDVILHLCLFALTLQTSTLRIKSRVLDLLHFYCP